jgi:hypothetical protein
MRLDDGKRRASARIWPVLALCWQFGGDPLQCGPLLKTEEATDSWCDFSVTTKRS